jgi:hypothetical protein
MAIIASSSEPGEGLKETSAPPVLLDPKDPLPEGNFLHQRELMYILVLGWLGFNAAISLFIREVGAKQPTDALEAFTVQLKINAGVLGTDRNLLLHRAVGRAVCPHHRDSQGVESQHPFPSLEARSGEPRRAV